MPAYICPQCFHELRADAKTLLYLINHPPKCTKCGYIEEDHRESKHKQLQLQVNMKGMRRTVRLYDAMYNCGKESAINNLRHYAQIKTPTGKVKQRKGGVLAVVFLIIGLSVCAGFIPLFIELAEGPLKYVRDMTYVPGQASGSIWVLYGFGPNEDDDNTIHIRTFDPLNGEEMQEVELETPYPLNSGILLHNNGKVWIIGNNYSNNAMLYVLNADDGSLSMGTDQFLNSAGIMNSGLADLQFEAPYTVSLVSKDGQSSTYNIKYDIFFRNRSESYAFNDSVGMKRTAYFDLQNEESSPYIKRLIYKHMEEKNYEPDSTIDPRMNIFYSIRNREEMITTNISQRNFIDADIVYADRKMCAIKHYSEHGNEALLVFSAYDISGKEIFNVNLSDCIPEEGYEEDYYYKYTPSRYQIEGSLFVITFGNYGICGIDIRKGSIIWKFWIDS